MNKSLASEDAAELQRVFRLGDLKAAQTVAGRLLDSSPDHGEALYVMAVVRRYQGQIGQAADLLQRLLTLRPNFGRAWQELGHGLRKEDKPAQAAEAYRQAVRFNPVLHASWDALRQIHRQAGHLADAEKAQSQYLWSRDLPKALQAALSFFYEGDPATAEELVRKFLIDNPKNTDGMRLLAELGLRSYAYEEAEYLLRSALSFRPDLVAARFDLVNILHKRFKYAEALDAARLLKTMAQDDPAADLTLANQLVAAGQFDAAIDILDRLHAGAPGNSDVCLTRGHALKTIGRQEEAIASYRSAYRARPDFGDAYWSLANLKTVRLTPEEIERMRGHEADPRTALADRIHFCFALGKVLEDIGQFEESFHYYARGNELKFAELNYDPAAVEAEIAAQKAACGPDLFASSRGSGCPAADPIFIVGMPRAGSTLLEQILASHSLVDGTMELPDILNLAHRLTHRHGTGGDPRYPYNLASITPEELASLGESYIVATRIHRHGAPFFIDKMPNNFRHIGLIKLILPNARIIDARRAPMDCCFSNFKQFYAEGNAFSYGLDSIGRYYRGYVDLMAHWETVLPGAVLRVQHEDLLADFDGQLRRLLAFCGLPFEPSCLDFHRTERAVRTASSEQVRRPLNRDGMGQWRPYERHLGPLKAGLGGCAEDAST